MSEPMDVLDKMVLGEATDEMLDDAHNEDKTTKVEESVALKTEDIFDEVANEANHLITDTTAANEQVELDEVSLMLYLHRVHCRCFGDLGGSEYHHLIFPKQHQCSIMHQKSVLLMSQPLNYTPSHFLNLQSYL